MVKLVLALTAAFDRTQTTIHLLLVSKAKAWKGYHLSIISSTDRLYLLDLDSPDLRCNEGGLDGSSTAVREISAGSKFTFHSDVVGNLLP